MRTPIASETLEIAFMLCCFHQWGAPVTNYLLWWARKTLWQNGELTPEQIEVAA
jgi:hypothetical protein